MAAFTEAAFITSASIAGSREVDGTVLVGAVPAGAEVAREWPCAEVGGAGVVRPWRQQALVRAGPLPTLTPLGAARVGDGGAQDGAARAGAGAVVGTADGTMDARAGVRSGPAADGATFR